LASSGNGDDRELAFGAASIPTRASFISAGYIMKVVETVKLEG